MFVLITLISLGFSLVPIWKFDQNAVSFFSSESPNYREDTAFAYNDYVLKNIYKKNDGAITVEHKLTIYKEKTIEKNLGFSNMHLFEMVKDYNQIICPEGKFMPLDADGNQISIPISNSHLDWRLKCVGHGTGVFLTFFLNKDYDSCYGYLCDKNKVWDGGNDIRQELYDYKITNDNVGGNDYPIVFIAKDGDIQIFGATTTLATWLDVHRDDKVQKKIFYTKDKTYACFDDNSDKFYIITYNKDKFSIAYSTKESIGTYSTYDNINNLNINKLEELTLPFVDKVEILSMNFIKNTP